MRIGRRSLLLAGVAATVSTHQAATAQVVGPPSVSGQPATPAAADAVDAQGSPGVNADEDRLELSTEDRSADNAEGEIIVTAQRREESLQRTPVSVSVLSSEALVDRAVTTQSDLQIAIPGLTVRASADANQLNYAIRGQSLDAFSATRPGVLPYFNEVQVAGPGGASSFYDLASIQVLKGPQGTLFGRNATGGAVLFTTARPTNEFGGYALGRAGNYGAIHLEGALNFPLVDDKVLLRVAGVHQYRRGFQRNLHPFCARPRPLFSHPNDPPASAISDDDDDSCRIGTVDRTGGRLSLTLKPGTSIENNLVVDYFRAGGSGTSGVLYSLNPGGAIPGIALTDVSPTGAPTMEAIISAFVEGAGGPPGLGAGAAARYRAAAPFLPIGGLREFLPIQQERGPFRVTIDGLNSYRAENWLVSNVTTIDVGPNTQIKNVFGFTKIDSTTFSDIDGTPFGIDNNGFFRVSADGPNGRTDDTRQFSEELQLLGEIGALSYVTGLYYSNERLFNLTTSDLFDFPIIRTLQFNTSITKNKTYAGYAQGTYDLSGAGVEGLSLRAGLRYTKEDISLRILPRDVSFNDPPVVQARYLPFQEESFNTLAWTLGVDYQVTPDILLYAANRRSYRHGGFNNVVRPVPGLGTEGGNAYDTETVTDVELGLKVRGRAGVPYRFNLAVYQAWIEDAQRVAYTISGGSPAAITVNVPEARVRGFEMDGQISATEWLSIGGQLNYTDADFTDNLVSILGAPPVEFGTYPDVPKWSGAAYADLSFPLQGDIALNLRGDVYAQTRTAFSSTANLNPGARLPGYTTANFRIGVQDDIAGWSVAAILKNAFDKVYYVGGVALGELFQTNSAVPGEPRTFLAEVRYRF